MLTQTLNENKKQTTVKKTKLLIHLDTLKQESLQYEEQIEKAEAQYAEYKAQLDKTELIYKQKSKIQDQIAVHKENNKEKLSRFDSKVQKLRTIISEYKNAINQQELEIVALEQELFKYENDREQITLTTNIEHIQNSLKKINDDLNTATLKSRKSKQEYTLSKYWSKGFKDIRFSTFNNVIQKLEELLNLFCKQQGLDFDHIKVLAWKPDTTKEKEEKPEIGIYVVRKDNKIHLDALSEGETQKVNLACFFTFSALIQRVLGFSIGFNVLDEPLSGLDANGKQQVFEIIKNEANKHQVFVIDHDAHFQNLFNNVIEITKEDHVSKIYKNI